MAAYDEINTNIDQILVSIEPAHVTEYDWLVGNSHRAADSFYRRRYKRYWGLTGAGLSEDYCEEHFRYLQETRHTVPLFGTLVDHLCPVLVTNNTDSFQFSFCTKLCHMIDRNLPVYDSSITKFYDFAPPASSSPAPPGIKQLLEFHQYLVTEYNRVLETGLLNKSIDAFRHYFHPQHFTDVKVVDSLIRASNDNKTTSGKEKSNFEAEIRAQIKVLVDEHTQEILQPKTRVGIS